MSRLIERKLARMRQHGARVLDLFAGCGGLSLGFRTAGAQILGALEINPHAAASHHLNFGDEGPSPGPISIKSSPEVALRRLGIGGPGKINERIDILIGGPPCQAYSRVGRAKLRAEALRRKDGDAAEAHLHDSRTKLYLRYIEYVRELRPVALLMENVPDILNHGGQNLADGICKHLKKLGYEARYTLLNACNFGVPEIRERMFLVAIHRSTKVSPEFPTPRFKHKLPKGYDSTRSSALQVVFPHGISTSEYFIEPRFADPELPEAITVGQAIDDLPKINAQEIWDAGNWAHRQTARTEAAYRPLGNRSDYARLMREWRGIDLGGDLIEGHITRCLPRDFKFFKKMRQGWEYPKIHAWVEKMRSSLLAHRTNSGKSIHHRNREVIALKREWTIPYDVSKFRNKWWKLEKGKPSRTLTAHLGKDSYSHIHYSSEQARTITIREAARLQSFPDGFQFAGGINAAFQQIGNAVPPLMGYALARQILGALSCDLDEDIRQPLFRHGSNKPSRSPAVRA